MHCRNMKIIPAIRKGTNFQRTRNSARSAKIRTALMQLCLLSSLAKVPANAFSGFLTD